MKKHVLYFKPTCPFCKKVRAFIEANEIAGIEERDIKKDPANEAYLIEKGGKDMVPCLFIDGNPLYESEDIIDYLDQTFCEGQGKRPAAQGPGMCPID